MAERVEICEVGLRDGLQNEKKVLSTEEKCNLLTRLIGCGLTSLELTSFVSPKAVPQLADAEKVFEFAKRFPPLHLPVLVINDKGYERAKAVGAKSLTLVLACSESFAEKNNRMTLGENLSTVERLTTAAKKDGMTVRVSFSVVWVCPFEGKIKPETVYRLLETVSSLRPDEVSLADTVGRAKPEEVGMMFEEAGKIVDPRILVGHFHDTTSRALDNTRAALQAGVRIFDSSIGGLGGCPFAPGASGNVATEVLVSLFDKMGFETGVDIKKLRQVAVELEPIIGRPLGRRETRAS